MTNDQTPGVYWQDLFAPPEPPFLTGIPVFLGYIPGERAPEEGKTPQLLTLWTHFAETFGPPQTAGSQDGLFLAHAVRGFFENGGLFCYVVQLNEGDKALTALCDSLKAVAYLDAIDLICVPDLVGSAALRHASEAGVDEATAITMLQNEVLDHCQDLGNRFAILDALKTTDSSSVKQQAAALDSDMGAIYHPWVRVSNSPGGNGASLYVPPCGHVAGIYARSDQQVGVHKAPANERVYGTLDIRVNPTHAEIGQLNRQGVNTLAAFPGRGIRIWGARTLSPDPIWIHINVRRFFVTVSRWLERFMTNLAFEANDIRLWLRITREISAYCTDLFRHGLLKGHTATQAFYVKCDSETNPAAVIDAGMVVAEVGLAPVAPSEFITVRIIHGDSGVRVEPVN